MEDKNEIDYSSAFTETMIFDFPMEVKHVKNDGGHTSFYIPMLDTYGYVKDINNIEEVKHKLKAIISIWVKFNLDHHMHKKAYDYDKKNVIDLDK